MAAVPTPHPNHRFRVEIDGIANIDFSEVILPEAYVEIIEHREGSSPIPRKIAGIRKFTNLTLKRGVTTSNDLFNWWKSTADGHADQRNVAVALLDQQLTEVKRWSIHDAWAARYSVSPLIAPDGSTLVVETLECAVDRFEVVT
jgi:phage tail-like protein